MKKTAKKKPAPKFAKKKPAQKPAPKFAKPAPAKPAEKPADKHADKPTKKPARQLTAEFSRLVGDWTHAGKTHRAWWDGKSAWALHPMRAAMYGSGTDVVTLAERDRAFKKASRAPKVTNVHFAVVTVWLVAKTGKAGR